MNVVLVEAWVCVAVTAGPSLYKEQQRPNSVVGVQYWSDYVERKELRMAGATPVNSNGAGRGRSGRLFFAVILVCIVAGILSTVLLANGQRNLHILLTLFGYPNFLLQDTPDTDVPPLRESRGTQLPATKILLPGYLFVDLQAPEQRFLRLILSDPKTLCETLRGNGFKDLEWVRSGVNSIDWECSSFTAIKTETRRSRNPSSLFLNIRGDGENRVTSFRVKLNIESIEETDPVVNLAGTAVEAFLLQVRWENASEIITKIRALEDFDIQNFGSHIQFMKEFGDPPRYNFLAFQIRKNVKKSPSETYFDRKLWFPLYLD